MKASPFDFGPQPFSRQQRFLLLAVAGLLLLILAFTLVLTINVFQVPTMPDTARILPVALLATVLMLGGLVAVLASTFRRTVGGEFARAYQSLEAQVLERKRAEETLQAQNDYLAVLNEIAVALVGRHNLDELLVDILSRAGELVGTKNGYVFLLDPEMGEMTMRVGVGAYQEFVGTRAQSGVGLAGKVWQTGDAVAVDDYRNWSGRLADPSRNVLRAVVGFPLKSKDRVVGIIGLAHLSPEKRFGPTEMDVLDRFASLASIALDNAQLHEAAARELDQRRAAEKALAYEHDLLQAIMDTLPDLIFFKDRESRFVRSNAAHLRNLGAASMDEVFGKTDLDYHVDAPAHGFMEDEKAILETGKPILNKVEANPAKDGTPRYFSTSKVAWRDHDGNIIGTLGVAHDITEHVATEAKLEAQMLERQRAEQFLDSIVDNLPTMLFVKDADELRFVRWNKAAETITGRGMQELIGKSDYDFFPKEEADFFVAKDRETLNSGRVLDIPEEPIEAASGEIHWLHTKKFPVMDADGKPRFLVGISEDITESRRAQEDIRQVTQNARAIFWRANVRKLENENEGSLGFDWDTEYGNSDAIMQFLPIRIEPGQTFSAAYYASWLDEDARMMDRNSAQALRQGRDGYTQEFRLRDANDNIHWMYEDARVRWVDAAHAEVTGFAIDVTDRKAAEERVRENETLYQSLVETMPQALTRKDREGRVTFGNSRFFEDTGKRPQDVYGKTDFDFHPRELAEKYWQDDLRVLRDGETIDAIEPHERGDGSRITVHVIKTPLRNAQGEIDGMQVMFWDITEEQNRQEQVRQQNAYLNALQETSLGLMQRLDVKTLLQDIVARAGALVGTENGYVFLRDADAEEMEMRVGVGAYEGFVGRRTKSGVGLAGQVWETNEPIVVDDYRTFAGRLADPSRDILRAVAGVPLRSGTDVIGVIGLAYLDETRTFGEAEIQVLQRFAQLAVIALDNARLYETTQQELAERARAEAALAQQLRETELLNRVTSHAVNLDVDKALVEICRDMAEYFSVEQAGIALLSEDKNSLTVVADYSPEQVSNVTGYVIPVQGNPSTEIVLATRKPAVFHDAQHDPRLASIHDLMEKRATASILIAPLFTRDEVIGTLGIDSYEPREFTAQDVALVERVSASVSTALENARLYLAAQQELAERKRAEKEIRQRNQELEVISRVSAVMTTNIDMITALETLARELVQTFKARNCGIALLNPDGKSLTVVADALDEEHEEHAVGIKIPVEDNPSTQYVLEHHRSIVIPDAQTDPMTAPIHERMIQRRTKCLAIIPLMSAGEVIGTIGLDTTDPNHVFSDEEIRLAETMANQMANAIEKQRLFDQAKARARREQLTREIGSNLTRTLDRQTISQTMARELAHALGASHAVVRMGEAWASEEKANEFIYDQKEDVFVQANGKTPAADSGTRTGEAAETLRVPITLRGGVIGTVELYDVTQARSWNEDETALASTVVEQMALAVENARLFEQAQLRSQQTSILNEMARAISGELDQEKIFTKVLDYLPRLMPADALVLWLYDEATQTNTRPVLFDMGVRYPPEMTPSLLTPRLSQVIRSNAPIVIHHTRAEWEEERKKSELIFGGSEPSASLLYVPLRVGDRVRGVLSVQSYQFNAYGETEAALMTSVASHLATALENAQLFEQTENALAETQLLYRTGGQLNQVGSLQELVRVAAQPAFEQGAGSSQLLLLDYRTSDNPTSANVVVSLLASGEPTPLSEYTHFPIEQFTLGKTLLANPRELVMVEDVTSSPVLDDATRAVLSASRTQAVVMLPLSVEQQILGVIVIGWGAPHVFSAQERRIYRALAGQMALVLNNRLLLEQTEQALAETQTLYEISARLNSARTLQESLEAAAGPAIVQGASAATLFQVSVDENGNPRELEQVAVWPRESEAAAPTGTRAATDYVGNQSWIENPSEPFVVDDMNKDPRIGEAARTSFLQDRVQATALLPIRVGARWLGILNFNWESPHEFTPRDVRLFRSIMTQAATVLDNRRLFEETQQALGQTQLALTQAQEAQERLNLQYQTANILARASSFDHAVTQLLENTCRALNWEMGEYWGIDENAAQLALTHAWCAEDERLRDFLTESQGITFQRGEGLAGRVWEQGTPIWVEDISVYSGFKDAGRASAAGLVSALGFPLRSETREYGVTVFFTTHRQALDDTVLATMVGVGNQIGQFLERRRAEEAVRQQNTYLTALHDTTLGLMRRLDVNELLQNIITRAGELLGTEHGYVHLIEPGGAELRMRVGIGVYQDFVGSRVKRGQGLAGTIWRDQEPIVVDDYRYWSGRLPMVDRDVLRAVVGVPLKSRNETVGVLGLASLEDGRRFGGAQIEALNRFAELAAVALDNAQLYNASQQNITELSLVNRISLEISQGAEVAEVSERVVNALSRALNVGTAMVALHDRARDQIYLPAVVYHGERTTVQPFPFGKGFASHVLRTRQPLLVNGDVARTAAELGGVAFQEQQTATSYAAVPILDETGQAMGMLAVEDDLKEGTFDESTIRLLSTIAANLGVAIQRARLNEQTRAALAQTQRLAERERASSEIADKLYAAPDVATVLRTAAEELRKSTGSRRAVVRLNLGGEGDSPR